VPIGKMLLLFELSVSPVMSFPLWSSRSMVPRPGTVSMELFTGLVVDHTAGGHGASRERQFAVTRLHSATQFSCWCRAGGIGSPTPNPTRVSTHGVGGGRQDSVLEALPTACRSAPRDSRARDLRKL
jgi:hypothetical protein